MLTSDLWAFFAGLREILWRDDVSSAPSPSANAVARGRMHRVAELDVDVAVLGHGDPVPTGAQDAIRAFVDPFADPADEPEADGTL